LAYPLPSPYSEGGASPTSPWFTIEMASDQNSILLKPTPKVHLLANLRNQKNIVSNNCENGDDDVDTDSGSDGVGLM